MSSIAERLAGVRERVEAACRGCGRAADEVTLLAVSKTFPAEVVAEAHAAGQRHFGESRQQEAADKVAALPDGIEWHFIGRLQRNKVRKVLADFGWIHSIDSLKKAAQVSRIAAETGREPRVFLEVNLAGEDSKGGWDAAGLERDFDELLALPALRIEGLMTIPPAEGGAEGARGWFQRTRELRDSLERSSGRRLPGLSMGMSHDFEAAIDEGATIVRVGSAIFGERPATA